MSTQDDNPPESGQPTLLDATRYEILRHAEDLFGHYGYAKTNMSDIAGRCGMSPGNLYRYYRNKSAIGLAVVEAFFRQSEAAMNADLIGASDPETRIKLLITTGVRCIVSEMARNPKLMELVEFLTESDEAWASLQQHIAWKRDQVEAELKAGIAQGIFRDEPVYPTAVNLMHATKAFQVPQSLAQWRDPSTILPELDGVLNLIFKGVRVGR